MPSPLTLHYETLVPTAPGNTDAATIALALTPSSADVMADVDAATEPFALTPSGVDVLGGGTFTDAGTEDLRFTVTSTDTAQYVDAATKTLALVGSALDYKESIDAATVKVLFGIDAHECYAIATPDYNVTIFKRWDMQTPFATWEVFNIATRWQCFIIGTSFDIPC